MKPDAIILPENTTMAELERAAILNAMYLISDGCRLVVSPTIPPGWHRMGITHRGEPLPAETPRAAA